MKEAEIIQQWQFLGQVHPKLLKDEVLEKCKEIGITSLQSYVLWSEIEKKQGVPDFSAYDELVEKLRKHGLKWVPFIILGPNYATPDWFKNSEESVFAKCLEHRRESKIQSIWSPSLPKHVDRFLRLISEHYQDKSILESIELGISGNWGEALYPATGGFYKDFHTHPGFWCGDEYACQEYRAEFPQLKEDKRGALTYSVVGFLSRLPDSIKKFLKFLLKTKKERSFFIQAVSSKPSEDVSKEEWLNFVNWYLDSMTDWADFWLKTARKYFPETKIYLAAGGTGEPVYGADLSAQVKTAAKHSAGIRITNQTNDYKQSFILTRLVASACKFYNSYFVTEEAAVLQSPEGVVMRIFDAAASGAKGIYCKNFISVGGDPCIKKTLPVGEAGEGAENLKNNIHFLKNERPIVETAAFFPNTSIALNPGLIMPLYNKCAYLREVMDFDLVDEKMIEDGALENYRNLLILEGELPKGKVPAHVRVFYSPEELEDKADDKYDGVYTTRFQGRILYYNSTNSTKRKTIKGKTIDIEPNSISEVKI